MIVVQAAEFFTPEWDSEWDLDTIRYLVNQGVEHHATLRKVILYLK